MHAFFDILELRITLRCNLSCKYCFLGGSLHQTEGESMTLDDYKQLIGYCRNKGLKEVTLTGGEPLVRFTLLRDIVEFSTSLGLTTKIHSNGTLLSDDKCEQLIRAGLSEIRISIDSVEKILFEKITSTYDLYEKLNHNIQNLVKTQGLIVGSRFTITALNYRQISNVYHYCAEKKLDYLEIKPVAIVGKAVDTQGLQLTPEEHITAIRESLALQKTGSIDLRFDSPCFHFLIEKSQIPHYACACSGRRLSVSPAGDVTPCVYLGIGDVSIGNIFKDKMEDLYHGKFNTNMHLTVPEKCKTCKYLDICKGGCKARIYNRHKDFNHVSPECKIIMESMKVS